MSQPAARLGDMTAHGGVLTQGVPTVLINGKPAATLGSLHVCPLCSPGPHVGGPVLAGSPMVLIGGQPAARVGDLCACAAPAPDTIIQGSPNVLIGGASAGATPGLAAILGAAHGASLALGTPGTGTTARPISPYVGVGYVDRAGRPVTGWHYRAEASRSEVRLGQVGTGGQVWVDALAEAESVSVGLVGVHACRWEKREARVGETVGMSAWCVGLDGASATFAVWREMVAAGGSAERVQVWEAAGTVRGGRVEADEPFTFAWQTAMKGLAGHSEIAPSALLAATAYSDSEVRAGTRPGTQMHTSPAYECVVTVESLYKATSGPLYFQDWIEIEVLDVLNAPISGAHYRIEFSTGEVRRGTSNGAGLIREDGIPPGPFRLTELTSSGTPSPQPGDG